MREQTLTDRNNKWFSIVEIEVNSICNRKCRYCPVSFLPAPDVPKNMSFKLFEKIIDELKRVSFSGIISYHLYSEPLIRSDLELLIRHITEKLHECYQLLYTNGDFLTNERYQSLLKAGVNHFLVTRHGNEPISERENQTIKFPNDLIITNRGGLLFETSKPLTLPCYAPSEMLIITVNGDVLLCCDDAKRSQIMGNICENSVEEIWFSTKMIQTRELLESGNRITASQICGKCNNKEYITPNKNISKEMLEKHTGSRNI